MAGSTAKDDKVHEQVDMVGENDYVPAGIHRIAPTSTSKDLATLIGDTLPDDIVRIVIVREEGETEAIRYELSGTASATSPEWPPAGMSLPVTDTQAGTIELFAASTTNAMLILLTERS